MTVLRELNIRKQSAFPSCHAIRFAFPFSGVDRVSMLLEGAVLAVSRIFCGYSGCLGYVSELSPEGVLVGVLLAPMRPLGTGPSSSDAPPAAGSTSISRSVPGTADPRFGAEDVF